MDGRAAVITGGSNGIGLGIGGPIADAETKKLDLQLDVVPKEQMIQPEDIAGAARFLLSTSRYCFVPELQFIRPGDSP